MRHPGDGRVWQMAGLWGPDELRFQFGRGGAGWRSPALTLKGIDATIGGDLTVVGTFHATTMAAAVRASDVADYVFEPDYKLAPLSEVEVFTKANKHLPEVPSASEMEASGVDLAKMNMLLLKKVEELTLHAIEQNKRIEAQEEKIEQLRVMVSTHRTKE